MVTITTATGLGSGVVVSAAGVLVTNLHVIRGQTQVSVKLANGDVYDDVSVVDVDERKDLVLLKLKAFGLTAVALGNSDQVQAGDHVVLIGSPRGFDQSVSDGLISAVRDSGEGYRLFQTSAAASPGSSGGGMFNEFGELIGIVSAKLTNGENINFGIPVNYMRGFLSTQSRMTLAELAVKFPLSPGSETQGTVAAAASAKFDPAVVSKMATILSASTIEWTEMSDLSWSTVYKGENLATVTVYLSVVGDLVVSQSIIAASPKLSADQMMALLKVNFAVDLVKVSLREEKLVALSETELRLLDGPGLKRIVENVARCADDVAGTLVGAPATGNAPPLSAPTRNDGLTSLPLLQGHALIRYDSAQWKSEATTEAGTFQFKNSGGELWLKVISERIEIPLDKMPEVVLSNMRLVAADGKIVRQGYRTVNGLRMLFVEFEATYSGIAFSFYGHYYSDSAGTVQIIGWTGKNLINEYRGTVEKVVSGFSIDARSSMPATTSPTPSGAIARCENGVYVFAPSDVAEACGGARGIAEWYTGCSRPSSVGTFDWNRMTADQQQAACRAAGAPRQ